MTKLLQDVIDRVRQWPDERQDEAAQVLLELEAQRASGLRLGPEQVEEVARIQRKVADGSARFASDAEMAAFWKSCGLSGCATRKTRSPTFDRSIPSSLNVTLPPPAV